jgi:V/A-type H+-transporting ATPase subunit A
VAGWWAEHLEPGWQEMRGRALVLLQEDYQLQRIVKIIGEEALPDTQRLTLAAARWLKEGFLQQSAFDPVDMFCLPAKQIKMLKLILATYGKAKEVMARGVPFYQVRELEELGALMRMKSAIKADELEKFDALEKSLRDKLESLAG